MSELQGNAFNREDLIITECVESLSDNQSVDLGDLSLMKQLYRPTNVSELGMNTCYL